MSKSKLLVASILAVAGLILSIGSTAIGQPDAVGIKKIAELIRRGDMAAAKKEAAAYAKKNSDMEDLMMAFKDAKKNGLGVNGLDGIEKTLNSLAKVAPNPAAAAGGYEQMGYDIAAVGLITEALIPKKFVGKQNPKNWIAWSNGLVVEGVKIANAAKANNGAGFKVPAGSINANCNKCHTDFRP